MGRDSAARANLFEYYACPTEEMCVILRLWEIEHRDNIFKIILEKEMKRNENKDVFIGVC